MSDPYRKGGPMDPVSAEGGPHHEPMQEGEYHWRVVFYQGTCLEQAEVRDWKGQLVARCPHLHRHHGRALTCAQRLHQAWAKAYRKWAVG